MKQLKKLTLNKVVISNLNGSEMNQLKGGITSVIVAPNPQCAQEYVDYFTGLLGGTTPGPTPGPGTPAPAESCGIVYTCNG
ncbi:hypothetical protein FACS1894123_01950 [Bacteroidia bacterium]|nr:hypothetical protein FACS1894123_01950 [Bacteroidia bacterium]